MIVMSYSPGIFVQSWLDAHELSAELICPDFDVSQGIVKSISKDEVTDIYLNQPKAAKRDVINMLNIMPSVSVGDNHKRDVLCDNYKKIRIAAEHLDEAQFDFQGVSNLQSSNGAVRFFYKGDINQVLRKIGESEVTDVTIEEPTLEEIFMHYYE